VLGTPGGSTIITSVFQTLVNLLDFGMTVDDAVNKPKFHHQWQPDIIEVEPDFPEKTKSSLEAMGYTFKERASIGRMEVIRVGEASIEAVGDRRGDDSAAGF
jgi:gamma-glutamyltranspeptidase/glutathione hydrolase